MTTFSEKARTFMFTIPASIVWYAIAGIILYSAQMQFDFRNMSTYFWILALIVPVFFIVSALVVSDGDNEEAFYYASLFTIIASAAVAVILAIVSTFGTNLYHSKSNFTEVASYVEVQKDGELAFPELIKDGDTSKLPLFGEQEARKKAEAELASSPLSSQTSVINSSFMSQNVNGDFVYIGESAPNSVFKRSADNMYYVINRNTGKTEAFHPEFLYGNSRYFSENAARMIKNWYSGKGYITDVDLEIDNDGNPMYVGSIVCRNRLNGLRDVIGIVVLDSVNGKIKQYDIDEVPEWVDRVYPEEVLTQRISIWGKYGKGFKNSLFKKEGVLIPTSDNAEGSMYEVVYMNGEAYIWTGMIPANASGTAVNGIIVASLKTGKITYYEQSGISEKQACSVAEGLVQEKGYTASFPVPLKINGIESMFMLMRDDAGNIAGYALVAYDDYTKSAYATTVNEVIRNFVGVVGEKNEVAASDEKPVELTGDIVAIATEVVDGRTVYYFAIDGKVFTCNSKINTAIVFAKVGDRVKIKYLPTKNGDTYILKNFEFVENTFEIAN